METTDNIVFNYTEVCVDSPKDRGRFIPASSLFGVIKDNPDKEIYRSLFYMDSSCMEINSITEYKGNFYLPRLLFDFDFHGNGQKLINQVLNFKQSLNDRGANEVHIWFSGRGFHVVCPDYYGFEPSETLPSIVKETLFRDFKGHEIDNIYDRGRIIRAAFSLNNKTGLYKIPVNNLEEYMYEDVLDMAKERVFKADCMSHDCEPIWKDRIAKRVFSVKVEKPSANGHKYNGNITCVQKMAHSDYTKGRNNTLLRMAMVWKNMWGLTKEQAFAIAGTSIPSLPISERESQITRIYDHYDNVYRLSLIHI